MTILYYKAAKKLPPPPAFGDALRLIYIGYNDREETLMPSAFHRHEHNLELQLICQGRGHIRIGSRMYDVQRGDVLVYNQGVLHDESADPATGLWFYNCGIRGLQLEGLPENCLLPDTTAPLLHAGDLMPTLRSLFRILYGQVQQKPSPAPSSEHSCRSCSSSSCTSQSPPYAKRIASSSRSRTTSTVTLWRSCPSKR